MPTSRPIAKGLPIDHPVDDVGIAGPRPNILVICVDQMRGDWMGCAGHPLVQTPHLDVLARRGVRFARAMSECPVCVPARRILMTGKDPWAIKMFANRDVQPFPEGPKLAALLSAAGWQCHAVGKLHVWPPRDRIGFNDVELNEEGRTAGLPNLDDYQIFLRDQGLLGRAPSHGLGNNQYGWRLSPLPEPATTTGWTAERAMRFIDRRDPSRPFFLYVSFDKPHPPFTPPAEYWEIYRDAPMPPPVVGDWLQRKPPAALAATQANTGYAKWNDRDRQIADSKRAYAALIHHIDARIGMLLGTLRERRLLSNTIVLFTADHGDALFDHHHQAKGNYLQGSCGIPLILCPAPNDQRNDPSVLGTTVTNTSPGLADVMPTLLECADLSAPADLAGSSLVPFLRDSRPAFRPATVGRCGAIYGVATGRYRYSWYGDTGAELLFDLDEDPGECHDLADEPALAATLAEMREHLARTLRARGDDRWIDGQVRTIPVDHQLDRQHLINHWNLRGWR